MTTSDLYAPPRPTISYELYPPRTPKGQAQVWETVEQLTAPGPAGADYFSVTYGASGSTAEPSRALVEHILATTSVPVIAHLTCVGRSREQLRQVVGELLDAGTRDFLALRGDAPQGQPDWVPDPEGLARASELVELIREVEAERYGAVPTDPVGRLAAQRSRQPKVSIAVAAYPGHRQADGTYVVREDELAALRAKQDAGADFAITQFFFDAEAYVALQRAAWAAGIHLPLLPGILPLTEPNRIRKLCALNGLAEPTELLTALETAPSPQAAERIGLSATAEIARAVLRAGAPGLHLYTFNRHEPVVGLLDEVLAAREGVVASA